MCAQMIRLLLAFCVGVPPFVDADLSALCSRRSNSTPTRFSDTALSPPPAFMVHALTASAYKICRLLAPHAWAPVGDVAIKSQIWELEPAKHRPGKTLRMDDSNQRSSAPEYSLSRAKALLEDLRKRPMMRGALAKHKQRFKNRIANVIESQQVPGRLADRIALQLLFKFDLAALGDEMTWQAVGQLLRKEAERLKKTVGLTDQQIITILPKLSADQVRDFFEELHATDPTIARTILSASLGASEPIPVGRRYLMEFKSVVEQLKMIDEADARTFANAAFKTQNPGRKAMDYLRQFRDLLANFQDSVVFVRTLARAAFSAPDPLKAARDFVVDYNAIVAEFTSQGVEPDISRTLAGIASLGAKPLPTAYRLLQNFKEALRLAEETHPSVARSIALGACRAVDPINAARRYMENYDAIIRFISQTDPQRAREVAGQAFRSDKPLPWARRYLKALRAARSRSKRAA
jgi:hypothetical protein